jgi:hypothetical protein
MKQTFNLLLILVVTLVAYSCASNAEKSEGDSIVKSSEIVIDTALVAGQNSDELAQYEISKDEALGRLHAFQMNNPEPGAGNPNYISIPLNEFAVLMEELDGEGSYAAFAKNGDQLEIIFVGKPKNGNDEWRYFNFTRPCPPACPKDTIDISTKS